MDTNVRLKATSDLARLISSTVEISKNAPLSEKTRGEPCSQLVAEVIELGAHALAQKLIKQYGLHVMYRLNGNKFVLYWNWQGTHLSFTIGGVHADLYPSTVYELKKLIAINRWGPFDQD